MAVALAASTKDPESEDDYDSGSSSSFENEDDEEWGMGFLKNSNNLTDDEIAKLQETLDMSGQGHLLQYLPELNDEQKQTLFKQIGMINPSACNSLYNSSMVVDDSGVEKSKHLSGLVAF